MAITASNYKAYFWVLILTSVLATGCSSSKSTASKSDKDQEVAYDKLKFDQYYLEGLKQKTLGNYDKAQMFFERCAKMDPTHAATLYELAQLNERSSDYQAAYEKMQVVLKQEPDQRWYLEYTAALAQYLSKYDEASDAYQTLIENYPDNPENYFQLANTYLYANKLKDAAEVYDQLEEKMGFTEDIATQKYKIYMQLEDTDKARAEVEKLRENNPEDVQYYGMLAKLYRQEGQPEKAIEIYKNLLTTRPDDPNIHLSLYEFYTEAGDSAQAFQSLTKAFTSPDMNIDNKIGVLINYYKATETDESLKPQAYQLLDAVVDAHPKDPKGYAMYGDFLFRDEKLESAREMYYKSIELDNSKYLVWNQLLYINSELQDVESMIKDSEQAMELFPNQPMVYLFNGLSHLQKEEYKEAAFALEQGQGLVVDNPAMQSQFLSNLGDAYYNLNKFQQAWMNYERALKINPENDYVLNNYSYFLSLRKENLDLAQKMSYEVVRRNPNNATYLDTHAWVLFQMENYSSAKEYIEQALQYGGQGMGEILEHYGDILSKLNETDLAIEKWKAAKIAGGVSDKIDEKITSGKYVE